MDWLEDRLGDSVDCDDENKIVSSIPLKHIGRPKRVKSQDAKHFCSQPRIGSKVQDRLISDLRVGSQVTKASHGAQ